MTLAYEEIVDFIAHGSNPADVARFQPSEKAVARVRELLERQKSGGNTEAETRELEQALQLEHLMRLAKAKARQYIR
jgi:hypothetical protein